MSDSHSQTGSSATRPAPVGATPPPRAPRPRGNGPETVVNPEGRPSPLVPPGAMPLPTSSIVRTLFPHAEEGREEHSFTLDGVELGHFKILERIRSGGMGAVFRALDTRLNRVVALKVLPPIMSRDQSAVSRFRNEAQAAAQLDHENIARVYYIGEDQGLHFIAFEFITGTNVRELIIQQGHLQVTDAVNYTLQIASALLHTAAKGVVHRDIKPSNIIITPNERAKLVDLGLARKENKEQEGADLTTAGTTLGTFDYISPEQARDPRSADVRSDIYSLGCTLYHMLTGEPPYPEGTVLQKLLQHQGDEPPDPVLKNRHVPDGLSAVVKKMMNKDPRRRYQTAEQLVRDLMLLAGAMGLRSISPEGLVWMAARPVGTPFLERHLAWMATVAALLLIVGYMEFGGFRFSTNGVEQSRESQGTERNRLVTATSANAQNSPAGTGNTATGLEQAFASEKTGLNGSAEPETSRTSPGTNISESDPTASRFGGEIVDSSHGITRGPAFDPLTGAIMPQPLDRATGIAMTPIGTHGVTRGPSRFNEGAPQPGTAAETGNATSSDTSQPPSRETALAPLERPENGVSPSPALADPAISIIGNDGVAGSSFPTLEAACSAAVDGSIIVLRYNGVRREKPLRVTKRITIRAGRGYRPVIEFVAEHVPAEGYQTRMITLSSGAIDLVGVDLVLPVDDAIPADQWAIFSVQRADALRVQGATMTVQNPRQRPAAVFELQTGAVSNMPEMEMGKGQMKPVLDIRLAGSLVRGATDLFLIRHLEPVRLMLDESVLAMQGSILSAQGSLEMPAENIQWELRMNHVTAALAGSVLKLDSGNLPRRLLPVQVTASNSIFSSTSDDPLVSMLGNSPPQDFRPLLAWSGQRNFYERFENFWMINSTEGLGRTESQDFSAWQKNWGPAAEVDPHVERVVWKRNWSGRPAVELTAADFALDEQAASNPAVAGATDTGDAGADVATLALKLAPPE